MLKLPQRSRDRKWVFPVYNRSFESWAKEEGNGELSRDRTYEIFDAWQPREFPANRFPFLLHWVGSFTRDSRTGRFCTKACETRGIRSYHVGGNTYQLYCKADRLARSRQCFIFRPIGQSVVCFMFALVWETSFINSAGPTYRFEFHLRSHGLLLRRTRPSGAYQSLSARGLDIFAVHTLYESRFDNISPFVKFIL